MSPLLETSVLPWKVHLTAGFTEAVGPTVQKPLTSRETFLLPSKEIPMPILSMAAVTPSQKRKRQRQRQWDRDSECTGCAKRVTMNFFFMAAVLRR